MTIRTRGWSLVALQFVLLVGLVLLPRRPVTAFAAVLGGGLLVAGVLVVLASFRRLGNALTATPVPIEGAGLRTTGVYSWVRHPIYSGLLLAVLGYVVAVGSAWSVGGAVLLLVFFLLKSRWEDRLLAEAYPGTWQAWAEDTGALIPRLSRFTRT